MKAIGSGAYVDPKTNLFYVRPTVDGKRTWRRLAANRQREAIDEARTLLSDQARAKLGLAKDPFGLQGGTVSELIKEYLEAGCPHRRGKQRTPEFVAAETKRLINVQRILGPVPAHEIRLKHALKYADKRMPEVAGGRGGRSVEMEMNTLSNVLNYAVSRGHLEINYIRSGRITPQSPVVHCRERMPASGDVLNDLAALLLGNRPSAVLGWQCLFEAMTGCRTSEVLCWQMKAEEGKAGHIQGDRLDLSRLKGGVSPWVIIHPDLRELIDAHHAWHAKRYPYSPWWFPGHHGGVQPVSPKALTHRLRSLTKDVDQPLVTSHGLRAFFVTKMRRDGHSDEEVAEMIGDRTVHLIQSTYGERRVGESKLSWRRTDGTAAWTPHLPGKTSLIKGARHSPPHSPRGGLSGQITAKAEVLVFPRRLLEVKPLQVRAKVGKY